MSRPLVVDCSAMVDALITRESATSGFIAEHDLHAPHLIDYEFLSAMMHLTSSGSLSPNVAREAIELWRGLEIRRHPAAATLQRTWDLRHNLSGYDASYVALAEAMDAPLLTADKRMAHAASRYCDVID